MTNRRSQISRQTCSQLQRQKHWYGNCHCAILLRLGGALIGILAAMGWEYAMRSVARINHQLPIAKDQKSACYAYEILRKVASSQEIALLSCMIIEQSPEQLAHGVMNYGITTHMGSEYALSLGKAGAMLHTRWGGQSLMSMSGREFEALRAEDLSKLTRGLRRDGPTVPDLSLTDSAAGCVGQKPGPLQSVPPGFAPRSAR